MNDQYGFQSGLSCSEPIWTLEHIVRARAKEGKATFTCFCDFRKAYPSSHAADPAPSIEYASPAYMYCDSFNH